jgi:hypothetical protein
MLNKEKGRVAMKAIIISHENGGTYVMDKDGSFKFVKGHTDKPVGTEIVIIEKKPINYLRVTALAACFALVILAGSFAWIWNAESHSIYIDVNPSVELVFNRFDRLIGTRSLNEGGERLLANLNLRGTPGNAAIDFIYEAVRHWSFAEADIPSVLISFSDSGSLEPGSHRYTIAESIAERGLQDLTIVKLYGGEHRSAAKELGVTPGRLKLAEQYYALNDGTSFDDVLSKPLMELFGAMS